MKTTTLIGSVCLCALAGCGLEGFVTNVKHPPYDRPASTIRGAATWAGASAGQLSVVDGNGKAVEPFQVKLESGRYEIKLPSSRYAMVRVQARAGNYLLRALVPSLGEESAVEGVNLDARNVTETLIAEARLSADRKGFSQLTPAAYVGDGRTNGTRTVIRQAFGAATPTADQRATQDLLHMVERFMARADATSTATDFFFSPAVLTTTYAVVRSPISHSLIALNGFDYDGDGAIESSETKFDAKLAAVARLYDPVGCDDPTAIRVVFSVDFNAGSQDGNCVVADRFKWVTDEPGKQMYFTGGIHEDSTITSRQRPDVDRLLGQWVPNQLPMYDDGTNGDEVAGDNVWTISFGLPRGLRLSYKYTWGIRGDSWTGTEEWPGNQRLLEVVDVNGDRFVHRRDVFGDEATNKDRSNLNNGGTGVVGWTTDLHGCGPEAHERPYTVHTMCGCAVPWTTPAALGPLTIACSAP